jgi:hypothetical protein
MRSENIFTAALGLEKPWFISEVSFTPIPGSVLKTLQIMKQPEFDNLTI